MSVAIRTSQNVLVEYEPASIGERILAAIIDYVVIFGWIMLTLALPSSMGFRVNSFYSFLVLFPVVVYDLVSEWLLNGRSLGKIAMKIRVVMLDGSPPGLGAYLIRWLLRIIESVAFLGGIVPIITVAANGKGQRLGDIAAGTTVVRLKPAVTLDDVILRPFVENYAVQFPDVRLLSDRDISVVRNVVRMNDEQVLMRTADKVKEVTGIRSDIGNREFLLTVINDYQFITAQ
ncbi:RDD family protein [Spirosoma sp. KCTC 42546]|uniref:RDD family protein n=1 Tax=Spirosoma sp. KCTC 42546 TaxID=2520506 RepID=UPI0011597C82|nr:RDD family protein [Spirosoma sp. KCTC 42546]QDK83117.1 RDD family protein [Spirosoma sp. KCTC 42546]